MPQKRQIHFSTLISSFTAMVILSSACVSEAASLCRVPFTPKPSRSIEALPLIGKVLSKKTTSISLGKTSRRFRYLRDLSTFGLGMSVDQETEVVIHSMQKVSYEYDSHFVEIVQPNDRMIEKEHESFRPNELGLQKYDVSFSNDPNHVFKPATDQLAINDEPDIEGQTAYAKFILEQLSFVFKSYKEEKHWPATFLRKLTAIAFKYAYHSTYIVVRAKTMDGKPGDVIGSIRLIQTPFHKPSEAMPGVRPLAKIRMLLESDRGQFAPPKSIPVSSLAHPEIWREIFELETVSLNPDETRIPKLERHGSTTLMPTPFEEILGKRYVQERVTHDAIGTVVEPGNFAIVSDRALSPEYRQVAAPSLYFHLARLVRLEAGAMNSPSIVGTYASDGGTSDRMYKSLGFGLKETITPKSNAGNPTEDNWNVLMNGHDTLYQALINRFKLDPTLNIDRLFNPFDSFEHADGGQHLGRGIPTGYGDEEM